MLLVTTPFLFSCSSTSNKPPTKINGTHNYENKEFVIKVMVHDSNAKLNKYIKTKYRKEYEGIPVEGFTTWYITKDMTDMDSCNIHVTRPRDEKNESEFITWGHELAHCIYGTFHN